MCSWTSLGQLADTSSCSEMLQLACNEVNKNVGGGHYVGSAYNPTWCSCTCLLLQPSEDLCIKQLLKPDWKSTQSAMPVIWAFRFPGRETAVEHHLTPNKHHSILARLQMVSERSGSNPLRWQRNSESTDLAKREPGKTLQMVKCWYFLTRCSPENRRT